MKLKQMLHRLPRSNATRFAITIIFMGLVAVLLWWRGPSFSAIGDAFTVVRWQWVAVAVGLNLASVVARAIAWRTVIRQAMPPPHPSNLLVFSAFSVGLFANAVLPGRIGELARVAVLSRKLPQAQGPLGDARRHGLRASRLRSRSGRASHPLRRVHVEDPLLGGDEPHPLRRHRLAALHLRVRQRAAAARRRSSTPWVRCAASSSMARQGLGVMRSPRRDGARDPLPDRRAGCASSSPSGRRCARSTSTRRCRPPPSCCC